MAGIMSLLQELDERTLAQRVGLPHDEARVRYTLNGNTVGSFGEFSRLIGDFYDYVYTTCISRGGSMAPSQAQSRAKALLEREYRRRQGDIVTAFNDAHDGTNGGMRHVLDVLTDGLKTEAIELHVRSVFDRHVAPNDWEGKVALIGEFLQHYGPMLPRSIRVDTPARYAQNYQELIQAYVDGLRQTSSILRRL